jgi:putative endonuclease
MRTPAVYLLASRRNGTLYVGVTSDLIGRIWQHRNVVSAGFTSRHGVTSLVWFETHDTMSQAIAREKAIKQWRRIWKIELIEARNPDWLDLYPGLLRAYSRG